jgi:rhodanese-related sulfurtransferase
MSNHSQKTELLDLFNKTRDTFQTFVLSRSESDKEEVGIPKAWSAKDLLANCAFWMQYMVERMEYYQQAKLPPRYVDFDALNQKTFEINYNRSWQEILAYLDDSLKNLIAKVGEFSEGELSVNNVYGDISDENQGGPLWGEIKANGFIYPLQELEKFYTQKGETAQAIVVNKLLRDVIGESQKIIVDLINAQALRKQQLADNPPLLIDVRDTKEYAVAHIQGAINIPFAKLQQRLADISQSQPIVTYCNMHHPQEARSERAALLLSKNGYKVQALQGGFPNWKEADFPIEESSENR